MLSSDTFQDNLFKLNLSGDQLHVDIHLSKDNIKEETYCGNGNPKDCHAL